MSKSIFIIFMLFASFMFIHHNVEAVKTEAMQEKFHAVHTTMPITVDGKLNEKDWKKATVLSKFKIENIEEGLPAPTTGYILYDDNSIYVGFDCVIPKDIEIKHEKHDRDSNKIFFDESVELMLDPGLSRDKYFQFIVNASGSIYDSLREQGGFTCDKKWNGKINAATFIGNGFWSCEIRVPFCILDIPVKAGKAWGFNLARTYRGKGHISAEASITASGRFHEAECFPILEGIDVDFSKYSWDVILSNVGTIKKENHLEIDISSEIINRSSFDHNITVKCNLENDGAEKLQQCKVGANEKRLIEIKGIPTRKNGNETIEISIVDTLSGQLLKLISFDLNITYKPLVIYLHEPHYRDMIFASQKLKDVVYSISSNLNGAEMIGTSFHTGIKDLSGKILVKKVITAPGEISFSAALLPNERMIIFVNAQKSDGKIIASATYPFRKLPYREGEVWRGKNGQWYLDGKKFFIIAEWIPKSEHVPGTNVTICKYPGTKWLSPLFALDNSVMTISRKKMVTALEEKRFRELMQKTKKDPSLFAYFLMDEPEVTGATPAGLANIAKIIRDEDPYHPIMVAGLGSKDFTDVAELNALHAYPHVIKDQAKANFGKVVAYMKIANDLYRNVRHPQTITYMQQGFNYGDWTVANTRVPNFDEIRSEFLISQILGAKGVALYMRRSKHYPELYIGYPAFIKELNVYAPVLLEGEALDSTMKNNGTDFYWTIRRHDGQLWIFAFAASKKNQKVTMDIPELGNSELQVMCENRNIKALNGKIMDTFDNFQVHVYTTDLKNFGLPSLTEIEEEINSANEARKKPGNIAFQLREGDSIDLNASSNKNAMRRIQDCLWHVTDGITDHPDNYYSGDRLLWITSPNSTLPHWIELDFRKKVKISKVIIYQLDKSLKDYKLQIWDNGEWLDIVKVKDVKNNVLEHRFIPVNTEKLRLYVAAVNGKELRISEIEVY